MKFITLLIVTVGLTASAQAQEIKSLDQIAADHPAFATIAELMKLQPVMEPAQGTGLMKRDYLTLISGNVDFFKQHQNAAGAIIDPYEKAEKQYATPAFALAAGLLVREARRDDLLEPATRAMNFSIAALLNRTTADNHADFYIPLIIHARRVLQNRVAPEIVQNWDRQLKAIVPERTYRDLTARNNWNLVNVSGESLRRKDGLVPDDQLAPHLAYLNKSIASQLTHFTPQGMFSDPNFPLAYDAFPRLWLEDVLADKAYAGEHLEKLREMLAMGSLSTLLLVSPTGEWASGGRSALHQWNEAQIAVIAEINAVKWKSAGKNDLAGAFKRVAHLAYASMKRWQRPSGELWIVKNRADPSKRLGYEAYSFHSQYNLLAMAMLAIAHERADDSIAERPIPAEYGSYVFDLREPFHKIAAGSNGTYILIDTSADPKYNATGLQRIHKNGVAFSPFSDTAAAERAYAPADLPKTAIAPGFQGQDAVQSCDLHDIQTSLWRSQFALDYVLKNGDKISESWTISKEGVDCTSRLLSYSSDRPPRFLFPALVSDGANDITVNIEGPKLAISQPGGKLTVEIIEPQGSVFALEGPQIPTHNGYVRAAAADLKNSREIHWRARLDTFP